MRVCRCRRILQQQVYQEQSQEQRCHSAVCVLLSFLLCLPLLMLCACITLSMLWQPRLTAAVLQRLRFVTATNGASVRVRNMWARHPEHNEGQFQPALTLNFKSIRASSTAAVQQQQQQQQRCNTSEPRNAHIHREACAPPSQLAIPPGFQVNQPHAEGEPCIYVMCTYPYEKKRKHAMSHGLTTRHVKFNAENLNFRTATAATATTEGM